MMSAPRMATRIPARALGRIAASTAPRRLATYMIHQESLSDKMRRVLANVGGQVRRHPFALGLGGGLVLAGLHSATGSASDFYDYRYKSNRDPDDLASFYGGEELMELFCVFPLVGQIMMRNAQFDDTGSITTAGFPGQMHVDMVFSDETNDATGQTDWFNKRERFRNTFMGFTCWDMVLNFGFRTKEDGTRECYHAGEYFHGNVPLLSQAMLLVFKVHARWVVWSVEHHVNHYAFASGDDESDQNRDVNQFIHVPNGEELEHESRANMPLFLLRNYAWGDIYAMLFGYRKDGAIEDNPSFLVTKKAEKAAGASDEEDDEEDDEDEDAEDDKLPFQTRAGQLQISEDIAADKRVMKQLLRSHNTQNPHDVRSLLVKRHTLARQRTTMGMAEAAAVVADAGGGADGDAAPDDVRTVMVGLAADRMMNRRMTRRVTAQHRMTTALAAARAEDTAKADGKAAGTVLSFDASLGGEGQGAADQLAASPLASPAQEEEGAAVAVA